MLVQHEDYGNKTYKITVRGKVQGVFFRDKKKYALSLHLPGYVQNMADGSVEIFVQGEKKAAEDLIQEMKKREDSYHIDQVELQPFQSSKDFQGFEILY